MGRLQGGALQAHTAWSQFWRTKRFRKKGAAAGRSFLVTLRLSEGAIGENSDGHEKKNYSRTNYTHACTKCLLYARGWKVEPTASYAARRNGQRFATELVDRILRRESSGARN
jgi:hypothetical protein